MGRFVRRRSEERAWVSRLPARFTMDDLQRTVDREDLPAALGWLYDAIQRGRVEPEQDDEGMHYAFAGERRRNDRRDRDQRAADASRR